MEDPLRSYDIKLSIPIKAPLEHVWNCLLYQVDAWWPAEGYTSDKTQKFIIEPEVGGRMYEDYGEGQGLLWAQVIVLDAPYKLEFKGHLTPQFGGPAINFLQLHLSHQQDATILNLTDTVMGRLDHSGAQSLEKGWAMLFQEAFKNYAEASFNS